MATAPARELPGGAAAKRIATGGCETHEATVRGMPLERRIYALTYDELEALRRFQEGSPAPLADDPAWSDLLSLGRVWVDAATLRRTVGLTSAGRGYATD